MDIAAIRKEKGELEIKIKNLMSEFEDKTSVSICDIDLFQAQSMCYPSRVCEVKIGVRL